MLAYVFLFVLGVSPVLQAVFDLPLQLAFQRAVLLACLVWFFLRVYGQGLPRAFAGKKFYLLWAAAGLSLLSLLFSPFKGYILNEWGNYAAGLLILLFASAFNKEERAKVERAITWGAWLVFAVSLLQAFVLENFLGRPPLTNVNALALYSVMIIPLALERRNWLLTAAMVILVVWTQSLGAALAGLAAAGIYAAARLKQREFKENARLLLALALVAAPVFYLLQADSIAGRLAWWRSALEMLAARPLSGFGHAAFTWAQAAFQPAGFFREHTTYAHNYYLEFLAENGLFAAAAWFWFLYAAVREKTGLVKYSVIAALAHSLVDFGLSVPANFWLFCWLLSSSSEEPGVIFFSRRAAGTALAFCLLLFGALALLDFRSLSYEKARSRALAVSLAGRPEQAEAELRPALAGVFRVPALEFLGRLNMTAPDGGLRASVYYEMVLLENRYDAGAWRALERIYARPGREQQAAALALRRAKAFR